MQKTTFRADADKAAIEAAAAELLALCQAALPAGPDKHSIIIAAMFACRNAAVDFSGGLSPRDELTVATSVLATMTVATAEQLKQKDALSFLGDRQLRDWVFTKIVSAAANVVGAAAPDIGVTRSHESAQPRREAS